MTVGWPDNSLQRFELAGNLGEGVAETRILANCGQTESAKLLSQAWPTMWTPQTVTERIASGSLLTASMFESLDANALLDQRDDSFDDDWVRAANAVQLAWDSYPDAHRFSPAIAAVREAAFKRTFDASGGHHDLAATVSDDFELICRRALLGVDLPFITALEQAYDVHQIPH